MLNLYILVAVNFRKVQIEFICPIMFTSNWFLQASLPEMKSPNSSFCRLCKESNIAFACHLHFWQIALWICNLDSCRQMTDFELVKSMRRCHATDWIRRGLFCGSCRPKYKKGIKWVEIKPFDRKSFFHFSFRSVYPCS